MATEANINVLHLTLSFATGGRRTAIETLALALPAATRNYLAVLNRYEAGQDEMTPYFAASLELKRSGSVDFNALKRLADFCRQHDIQVIHSHDAASQMTGALLRLRLPYLKLIMTFHRSLPMESASFKDKLRNALSCLMSKKVLCTSHERQAHFLAENYLPASKVMLIPLGVDTQVFQQQKALRQTLREQLQLDEETFLVGAIGHFGDEKGIDIAINCFLQFIKTYADVKARLVIVGKGDAQRTAYLQQLAAPAADNIRFLGYRNDIADLMQAMDCFLHVPRMEAFGLVLIEAMASGLPVIASNVGGIPDIVVDQQSGYLITNHDLPALQQALHNLYADTALRQSMGLNGRQRALAEFDAQTYAQRYQNLYLDLLA